ncbi:MAG: hypothetical protein GX811_00575, partial [Lentisphaerae bacterium]|nr:hypothetical protein [Lentisphaerota bacterium]
MSKNQWMDSSVPEIVKKMTERIKCSLLTEPEKGFNLAGQEAVHGIVDNLIGILYPGCHGAEPVYIAGVEVFLNIELRKVFSLLSEQVEQAFKYQCQFDKCEDCGNCTTKAFTAVSKLLESMPEIRDMLTEDVQAAYDGDPAAQSFMEIVMSYPGVYAITVHR